MKLLFYEWGSNNEPQMEKGLALLGHQVIPFSHECRHYTRDLAFSMAVINKLNQVKADGIFTLNYFPILSLIAQTCGLPYYSWVYDCPHFTLYSLPVRYEKNRIGIFDASMVRALNERGVNTVFHLPLWSWDFAEASGQGEESSAYACDISFVGSLYTGEYDYYALVRNGSLPGAEQAMEKQKFDYLQDYLTAYLASGNDELSLLSALLDQEALRPGEEYFMTDEEIIRFAILDKQVTVRERRELLSAIGARFGRAHSIHLHTASKNPPSPLRPYLQPPVDYHREMPLVFRQSKINLNISLRSIRSGIPLRAMDVLSCGGFLLSNYQPELAEFFKEDEELVLFRSLEEALEKADYYLTHEKERKEIAARGQQAIRERFGLCAQLDALVRCQ